MTTKNRSELADAEATLSALCKKFDALVAREKSDRRDLEALRRAADDAIAAALIDGESNVPADSRVTEIERRVAAYPAARRRLEGEIAGAEAAVELARIADTTARVADFQRRRDAAAERLREAMESAVAPILHEIAEIEAAQDREVGRLFEFDASALPVESLWTARHLVPAFVRAVPARFRSLAFESLAKGKTR